MYSKSHSHSMSGGLGADYMDELSRLSELTRFAELTRFPYVLSIIFTFRLHAKRVVPPCWDRGCSLPSQLAWPGQKLPTQPM